jgi:hypothetical protein
VDPASFEQFVEQLRELEARRQGIARLEAVRSPDEFWLEVRSIDRAGHMAVFGRLRRWQFMSPGEGYHQAVEFGFEFCPSLLAGVFAAFRSMASSQAEQSPAADRGR